MTTPRDRSAFALPGRRGGRIRHDHAHPLPASYFPWLNGVLLAYCALTQALKTWYIRTFNTWL
ncbi:hypothetical protein [Streptomyces sp. NPDC048269]|uniref:hypothetical protein n=1 Tax=Streptomyces sp. NPDC048269 TaxID=3155753 RepID=UPI0034467D73